jgi:hypothetical protein
MIHLGQDTCARIDGGSDNWTISKFDDVVVLGWLEGKYLMHGFTLGEICSEAERCYGVQFNIDNPATAKDICFILFGRDSPVEDLIVQIEQAGFRCRKQDNVWHITSSSKRLQLKAIPTNVP